MATAIPSVSTNYTPERALNEALVLAESLRDHRTDPGARPLSFVMKGFRLWCTKPGDVVSVTTESGSVWIFVINNHTDHRGGMSKRLMTEVNVTTNGGAKLLLADLRSRGIDAQPPAEIWLHECIRFDGCTTSNGNPLITSPVTSVSLNGTRML